MISLYEFLVGPGFWIALIVFFGGLLVRLSFYWGLSKDRDKLFYNHRDWGWGLKSIFLWLLPWGSASARRQPLFWGVVFVFHVCLIGVPLFLEAHNQLWYEGTGWSLWSMPGIWADYLTLVVIACGVFFLVRRIVRSEVRILTTAWDYFLILLTLAPFVTGYLAYHQYGPYELMLVLHIFLAEVLLVVIPFSKLGHLILFFVSRLFIGFEFGGRRGARAW